MTRSSCANASGALDDGMEDDARANAASCLRRASACLVRRGCARRHAHLGVPAGVGRAHDVVDESPAIVCSRALVRHCPRWI